MAASIHLVNACESVDAAVFSGDTLYHEESSKVLREYVGRWVRAIAEHDRLEAEDAEDAAAARERKS